MSLPFETDKTFCVVINHILNSEGGYSNHPLDPGGPTFRGVAWNYNVGYLKTVLGMRVPEDIKKLTVEQAKQLYYERYWLASDSYGITDIRLAYIHMDAAVNCGTGAAKSFLDKLSKNPKAFDGSGGKNFALFNRLFLEYVEHRIRYYTHCKNRAKFLEGWMNRTADVIRNSMKLPI